jgi:hypothetical protein
MLDPKLAVAELVSVLSTTAVSALPGGPPLTQLPLRLSAVLLLALVMLAA